MRRLLCSWTITTDVTYLGYVIVLLVEIVKVLLIFLKKVIIRGGLLP